MAPPEYYFKEGFRLVRPYFHFFQTHVKTRWLGRTLVEVYCEDLHSNIDRIETQVRNGKLYVIGNQGKAKSTYEVRDWETLQDRKLERHDVICNLSHIHEPAVLCNVEEDASDFSTEVVYEDESLIVVNKPSGVPTHPSGSYRYNSMTEILEHELQYKVYPCHRLDKSTSGILIMAKSKQAASSFQQSENTEKHYLARVKGQFPASESQLSVVAPIFTINAAGGYLGQANAGNLPLNLKTLFQRVSYNENLDQSIVLCQPVTGRMHQIRIHLRNMGFPIVNDNFYNYLENGGSTRICNKLELELYDRIKQTYPDINRFNEPDFALEGNVDVYECTRLYSDSILQNKLKSLQSIKQQELREKKEVEREHCEECGGFFNSGIGSSEDQRIWLHSLRYRITAGPGGIIETKFPDWYYIE